MKNILILTIDSPIQPFGGLGLSICEMVKKIDSYFFFSFGSGSQGFTRNLTHTVLFNDFDVNLSEYKKNVYKHRDIVLGTIGSEKIEVIHIFDSFYIDLGIELKNILDVDIVYTFALYCQLSTT